jgi:hypothetical protein
VSSEADALKSGKEGSKPVVLLFGDAGAKTKMFSEMLGDPSLDESFGNVLFASVEYKKDGEDAKKYKVTSAPTLSSSTPAARPRRSSRSSPAAAPRPSRRRSPPPSKR